MEEKSVMKKKTKNGGKKIDLPGDNYMQRTEQVKSMILSFITSM